METLSQKCNCLNSKKTVKMGHLDEWRFKPHLKCAWLLAFSIIGLAGCQLDNMNDARKFAKVILLTSDPQVEVKPSEKIRVPGSDSAFVGQAGIAIGPDSVIFTAK